MDGSWLRRTEATPALGPPGRRTRFESSPSRSAEAALELFKGRGSTRKERALPVKDAEAPTAGLEEEPQQRHPTTERLHKALHEWSAQYQDPNGILDGKSVRGASRQGDGCRRRRRARNRLRSGESWRQVKRDSSCSKVVAEHAVVQTYCDRRCYAYSGRNYPVDLGQGSRLWLSRAG